MTGMLAAPVARGAGFFCVWLVVSGSELSGLPTGVIAAALATWASLRLLPPGERRVALAPLARLVLRLLGQSVVAGTDVARRALDPRLPLCPGFVVCRPDFPPGLARNAFRTLMSLTPGTLPAGSDEDGALLVHCLDVGQPVAASLAEAEVMVHRVWPEVRNDG